ncbi:hypothetical protein AVEN_205149-1 [Araneus ventricosus]|uniref:Uncharacterized protein n=1 Tax=Araneus ventricosus TaxID=182803 RepID=A0A4Y2SW08_ARAVE|nr:hypothetical protein AVEN_213094-1 [Araneus ventricosus]GBN91508.1 hypothetical protein AVEN_205149-1 [Araneus ventricosus]
MVSGLLLCRKFAAKLPYQVCRDKLYQEKSNLLQVCMVSELLLCRKFAAKLPHQHEGKPYCNTPCYGALFGPGGFGRGGTESHTYKK